MPLIAQIENVSPSEDGAPIKPKTYIGVVEGVSFRQVDLATGKFFDLLVGPKVNNFTPPMPISEKGSRFELWANAKSGTLPWLIGAHSFINGKSVAVQVETSDSGMRNRTPSDAPYEVTVSAPDSTPNGAKILLSRYAKVDDEVVESEGPFTLEPGVSKKFFVHALLDRECIESWKLEFNSSLAPPIERKKLGSKPSLSDKAPSWDDVVQQTPDTGLLSYAVVYVMPKLVVKTNHEGDVIRLKKEPVRMLLDVSGIYPRSTIQLENESGKVLKTWTASGSQWVTLDPENPIKELSLIEKSSRGQNVVRKWTVKR